MLVGYYHQMPVCRAVTVLIDGVGSIHSFATHQVYQSKGYGSQMLSLVLARLYSAESDMVLLDSSENAVKLYARQGFVEIGKYIRGYVL